MEQADQPIISFLSIRGEVNSGCTRPHSVCLYSRAARRYSCVLCVSVDLGVHHLLDPVSRIAASWGML